MWPSFSFQAQLCFGACILFPQGSSQRKGAVSAVQSPGNQPLAKVLMEQEAAA